MRAIRPFQLRATCSEIFILNERGPGSFDNRMIYYFEHRAEGIYQFGTARR
jgi:hypothetical protein